MLGFVLLMHSVTSPVLLCLMLIGQILMCVCVCSITASRLWVTLIFMLIFFGGLMVLFVYIRGLIQREKINVDLGVLVCLLPVSAYFRSNFVLEASSWEEARCAGLRLYTSDCVLWNLALVVYLLGCIIAAVKIVRGYYGAMRRF